MLRGRTTPRFAARLPQQYLPMLASSLTSAKGERKAGVAPGPYFVSPKLDGIRCIITKTGCYSRRRHKLHGLDHILKPLARLFKADPSLVLDGELYASKLAKKPGGFESVLAAVTSLRRKATSGAASSKGKKTGSQAAKAIKSLEYHVFDVLQLGAVKSGGSGRYGAPHSPRVCANRRGGASAKRPLVLANKTPFYARNDALVKIFSEYNLAQTSRHYIRRVPHHGAFTLVDARSKLKLFLSNGFEGAVMRTFNNKYEPGQRSKTMIKIVPWHDKEFQVVRLIRAKKQGKSYLSKVECVSTNGRLFRAHVGVPDSVAQEWLDKAGDCEGVYATARFTSFTRNGVPRFAVVKCLRGAKGWFL